MSNTKLSFVAAIGLAVLCCGSICAASQPTLAGAPAVPWLHTQGDQIVGPRDQPVTLRGINLGGWLVEEPWMQPFVTDPPAGAAASVTPIVDHVSLWTTAKDRFGEAGMLQLRSAFRRNWITADDFNRIKADGLNCVRLPFLASLLDEPDGMRWLDQAVSWAGGRGIYVILDMHGAPGGQSGEAHTGLKGSNRFFSDPANVADAVADWRQIATHFRDNSTVAGYDLINEPMGTPGSDTLYVVQDRLYNAVRSVDTKHLIYIEDGYTGIQWMPLPAPAGWQNVVYSTHYYDFNAKSEADQRTSFDTYMGTLTKERDRRNIPYNVGEFGFEPGGTPATIGYAVGQMQSQHISWSMWTYKVMWSNGGQSLWALYCNAKPVVPLNFFTEPLDQLISDCAKVRTENLDVHPGIQQVFRDSASARTRRL